MTTGASNTQKFFLLLWKNYLLQRRKILVTIFEILLPTIFSLILIWIRQKVDATPVHNATTWPAFKVDLLPKGLCPDIKQRCMLGTPWKLFYTPNNTIVNQVMLNVKSQLGIEKLGEVRGFDTEQTMVGAIMDKMEKPDPSDILGGIVFYNWDGSGNVPSNLTYKIRLSASPRNAGKESKQKFNPFGQDTRWMTTYQFPLFQKVGPRSSGDRMGGLPGYEREGFLALQHSINQGVMSIISGNSSMPTPLKLRRMPYPPYNDDPFVIVVQNQLPLLLMLSFVFIALNIVKDVVHEKEKRIKETLKLMGLPNWMHWLAWFTKHIIFLFVTVGIITGFFVIHTGKNGAIIGYSSPTVLLVFLLVYSMATISFCFAVSVFFNKANTAAAAGGVLFFLTYVPYFFLQPRYDKLSWEGKVSSCLISNVALAFGGQIFGMFEGTGAGVQWSTIHQSVSVDDNFTLLHVILMLLLDTLLYGLLTWYVEAVRPGEFGIPQPWYFPVLKSYWCNAVPKGDDDEDLAGPSSQDSQFFEKDPLGLRAGIAIQGLSKEFGKGDQKNVAVAGTTLNMYEGQITALLGHNGAGKTTTMNMLTGFLPPTGGTAFVNGYNIRREISSVRNSLGLCPQHDVLFDTLTVEEHLAFFALVKGYPSSQLKHEIKKMLRAVGLYSKRLMQTRTLSGGQKRKLSVAIALIGGSKVVILDEPTSGMDPNARRHLWDVLQRHRAGRTMLLTTHFMDEADLLGDRIAIMADGVIQCCGSSLFLKNEYGAGYHMIIVKLLGCNVDAITGLVKTYVPAAKLESNVGAELSYILPTENSDQFERLFSELEQRSEELNIASFGASVTTMEEVFIRVGEKMDGTLQEKLQQTESMMPGGPAEPLFNVDIELNGGWRVTMQQFQAMLVKRILHTRRNLLITLTQLFIPTIFTIIGLIILKTNPAPGDSPALKLSLAAFEENVLGLSSGENPQNLSLTLAESYASLYRSDKLTRVDYLNNMTEYVKDPSLMDYFVHEGTQSLGTYVNRYIIGAEFFSPDIEKNETTESVAYFNDQAFHTPAITLSVLQSGIMRYLRGGANRTFTTINHPLPRTMQDKLNDELSLDFTGFVVSFHTMFGMAFLASSFVLFLIKERATKAKHCQFVSGVDSGIFWWSTFSWDFINYMLPVTLLLIAFYGFNVVAYVEGVHLAHILLLFVMYGWACLPFMYLLSFLFNIPSTGFVWLTMLNVISGVGTVISVRILQLPQLNTKALGDALKWIFLAILPNFNLGQGLQDYYQNHQYLNICTSAEVEFICKVVHVKTPCCKDNCGDDCLDYTSNYLSWSDGGIGRMLFFLGVQGIFYFCIIFMVESGLIRRVIYWIKLQRRRPMRSRSNSIHSQVQEDEDVVVERERIFSLAPDDLVFGHTLVLSDLTKYYGDLLAVDRLSFGIRRSQCFGLLGINGAGKTTTFKMLTGDVAMSSGNAFLQGYDIRNNIKQVQQRLGYCPQFDALIDQLTGRETLTMYCRLRGVSSRQIPGMVEQVIRTLLLSEHADKLVKDYSGGNKRKLSAAIALVGDPPVIFLDEPTTGMDPVARRLLWDTLSRMRDSGSTLVLTSHSMEECEALCTQIAIMVNGQIKCFGSTQHLKNKFGHGYTLLARIGLQGMTITPDDSMDIPEPDIQPFMDYIECEFPGSVLKDIHQGMVHYHIPDSKVTWSQLFGTMERCKRRFNIEDYSVSQTTLDQVFINFARSQVEPLEAQATRCQRCRQNAPWCLCCCCYCCCSRCSNESEDEDDDLLNIVEYEIA